MLHAPYLDANRSADEIDLLHVVALLKIIMR